MNSNNINSNSEQHEVDSKNASLQYGLSIAIGVLTIILLSSGYYFGLVH